MVDYIYSYLYHFSPCIALVFIAGSGREGCYPLFFVPIRLRGVGET